MGEFGGLAESRGSFNIKGVRRECGALWASRKGLRAGVSDWGKWRGR